MLPKQIFLPIQGDVAILAPPEMTEAAKMAYAGHASNTQVAVHQCPRKRNTNDATVGGW